LAVVIKPKENDQEALMEEETKLNTMNDIASKIQVVIKLMLLINNNKMQKYLKIFFQNNNLIINNFKFK
jgi:hypothetical protein